MSLEKKIEDLINEVIAELYPHLLDDQLIEAMQDGDIRQEAINEINKIMEDL